jgi:hypothetical protein
MRPCSVLLVVLLVLADVARSQCFNIDVGIVGTPPSNAYGAASGMSGFWNDVGAAPASAALDDINGGATCVTIIATTLGGAAAGGSAPLVPVTQPEDAALYDDLALVPALATTTWTLTGLAPATYDLYVYSVSPFAATNATLLTCLTLPSGKLLSGTWNGTGTPTVGAAHVTDLGLATFPIACTNGTISFTSTTFGTEPYGCVNGIQVVQRGGGCPAVYCTAGISGNGCVPELSFGGPNPPSASVHTSGFDIFATNVDGQKSGIFFYSVSGTKATPYCVAAGSYLCVKASVQRMGVGTTGGTSNACNGFMTLDWNAFITNTTGELGGDLWAAGDDVWIQAWYRDPNSSCTTKTSNTTEGLHFQHEL